MKKITIFFLVVFFCATSLQAQITQEQANTIVFQYLQTELTQPYLLYVYNHEPSADELLLTTYNEEVIKVKYPCKAEGRRQKAEGRKEIPLHLWRGGSRRLTGWLSIFLIYRQEYIL